VVAARAKGDMIERFFVFIFTIRIVLYRLRRRLGVFKLLEHEKIAKPRFIKQIADNCTSEFVSIDV
jgi:hypothetical protein